jgi:hypothetical protein
MSFIYVILKFNIYLYINNKMNKCAYLTCPHSL